MTESSKVHVAVYCRVSTSSQDLVGQLRELHDYSSRSGWSIVREYTEKISATGKVDRAEHDRLLRDARDLARPWDHLLVWSLDRWSREERFTRAVDSIFDMEKLGISFHSLREPYLDTPPSGERNLGRELLLGILPTIATFESIRRSERVRLAMKELGAGTRKTRSGKPVGRPWRVTPDRADLVVRLRAQKPPIPFRLVAQRVGLPIGTCRRVASQVKRGLSPFTTRGVHKGPV